MLTELYSTVESTGIYLIAPVMATLLERANRFTRSVDPDAGEASWPFFLGRLGGVPVWVDPVAAGWEIQILPELDGPPAAIMEVTNFVEKKHVLDRMAQIA